MRLSAKGWTIFILTVWISGIALYGCAIRDDTSKSKQYQKATKRNLSPVSIAQRPVARSQIILLTSYFNPGNEERAQELEQTLLANVFALSEDQTQLFDEIHLFIQQGTKLPSKIDPEKDTRIHIVETNPGEISKLPDRYMSNGTNAYLYSDFFEYANQKLSKKLVVLSNSDIEFDQSLSLIRTKGEIANGAKNAAYALSRINLPCPKLPKCRHLFCKPTLCNDDIYSYDAFVFVPPLNKEVIEYTNHRQDQKGSENIVVAILELEGELYLSNPCKNVKIFHRHCVRDLDAYLAKPRVDYQFQFANAIHKPLF